MSLAITGSVLGCCFEPVCLNRTTLRPSAHLRGRGLLTNPEKSLPSTFMVTVVLARVVPALLGIAIPPRTITATSANRSFVFKDAHPICDVKEPVLMTLPDQPSRRKGDGRKPPIVRNAVIGRIA